MKLELDGVDPEVVAAYLACLERVKRAQKRTVADYWYVGSALTELRGIVRRMPGVKWYEVYGKTGLGFSESMEWRYRRLAELYDTAEAAGQYTSVNKAIRAKGKDPTVCPGWSPKDSDEESAPGCNGKKTAQYRFCVPCTAAWAKGEKADAKVRRIQRQDKKEHLEAALANNVTAVIQRSLKKAYKTIEVQEQAIVDRNATIEMLRAELVECYERLEMVKQQSIPLRAPVQEAPTDWPAVTA